MNWTIGDVRITRVVELEFAGGTRFILPNATPEACQEIDWLAPHFMDERGRLIMSVHALVVDAPGHRIVVDTCIGNDKERPIPNWSHLQTSFLADLEAAGCPRESVDTVLCTHLHVDHVGWNTMLVGGEWRPTFPQARYLIAREEWRYWDGAEDEAIYGPVMADSVRPIVDAGLADFVESDHRICDEVRLVPSPGHTPGHVSVEIESQGARALITGDFVHHPCQLARLDWGSSADVDRELAVATRREFFERCADEGLLVIGTHFAAPTAGHIIRDGAAYRLETHSTPGARPARRP